MAERQSEYARIDADHYCTPAWVTDALLSVETFPQPIWECAPGDGHMVKALKAKGMKVTTGWPDFFKGTGFLPNFQSIITNPPYKFADAFIEQALDLTSPRNTVGKVAMLLPMAFDTAKGRRKFFKDNHTFKAKYVLTTRIRWANLEQKSAGPSMNHAWYVWDAMNDEPPKMGWLP